MLLLCIIRSYTLSCSISYLHLVKLKEDIEIWCLLDWFACIFRLFFKILFCFGLVLFFLCFIFSMFSAVEILPLSVAQRTAATIGNFSQMAFPCMKNTDKTMIVSKLSLHNSAFHSDLYFQSVST